MASHHSIVTIRPRNLANVLADLREAKSDHAQALEEIANATLGMAYGTDDLDDRATEAETRVDDLTDEFQARFVDATGLTIEDFRKAIEEALL